MLDPEVVVNLLPELGVGVDLVRHGRWLGETIQASRGTVCLTCLAGESAFF